MIKYARYLLLIIIAITSACIPHACEPSNKTSSLIQELGRETVALTYTNIFGNRRVYCSGVWVDTYTIITAHHCVDAVMSMNDMEDEKIIGYNITYIVQGEEEALISSIKPMHKATVIKEDPLHDLVLLSTNSSDTPLHGTARLASFRANVGDSAHCIGHKIGYLWTYSHAYISAYRDVPHSSMPPEGVILQTESLINRGNSGGAIFSENGELLGIASYLDVRAVGLTFYVPTEIIQKFLTSK